MASMTHFLVTFVVALLLLSTLNIVNDDILHIEKLRYIEITIVAVIFIISAFIYIKSYRKLSLFIKNTFLHNHLP